MQQLSSRQRDFKSCALCTSTLPLHVSLTLGARERNHTPAFTACPLAPAGSGASSPLPSAAPSWTRFARSCADARGLAGDSPGSVGPGVLDARAGRQKLPLQPPESPEQLGRVATRSLFTTSLGPCTHSQRSRDSNHCGPPLWFQYPVSFVPVCGCVLGDALACLPPLRLSGLRARPPDTTQKPTVRCNHQAHAYSCA